MPRELGLREVTAVGMGAIVLAVVTSWVGAAAAYRTDRHELSSATSTATGVVVEILPDELDARVRWQDDGGVEHASTVRVADGGALSAGDPFEVRFDPDRPTSTVVAADSRQAIPAGEGPIIAAALVTGLWGGWLGRWALRCRRRRTARPLGPDPDPGHAIAAGLWARQGHSPHLAVVTGVDAPPTANVSALPGGVLLPVLDQPDLDSLAAWTPVDVTWMSDGTSRVRLPSGSVIRSTDRARRRIGLLLSVAPLGTPRRRSGPRRLLDVVTPGTVAAVLVLTAAGWFAGGGGGAAVTSVSTACCVVALWAANGAPARRRHP